MSVDGSGKYSLAAGYFVTNGQFVLPSQHNPIFEDVQTAFNLAFWRDGRTAMTGPITLLGNAVNPLHAVPKQQAETIASTAVANLVNVTATADIAALKALDTSVKNLAFLQTGEREGLFELQTGDFATFITADTAEQNYIKADDSASTAKAWVRRTGSIEPRVFVVSGQSNTALAELTTPSGGTFRTHVPPPNLLVWNNPNFTLGSGDTSSTAIGTAWVRPPTNRITLGIACAAKYARENPQQMVYLITSGNSGMSITNWADSTPTNLRAVLEGNINAAMATLPAETRVDEFLWYQGESDVALTTYHFKFQTMVNNLIALEKFGIPKITIFGIINSAIRATKTGVNNTDHDRFNELQRRIVAAGQSSASLAGMNRVFVSTDWINAAYWDAFLHCRSAYTLLAERWYNTANSNSPDPFSGVWTPTLLGNSVETGVVYSTREGWFTYIDGLVTLGFNIVLTAKPSVAGFVVMAGIPTNLFPPKIAEAAGGGASRYNGCAYATNVTSGVGPLSLTLLAGEGFIRITKMALSSAVLITDADILATFELTGQISYRSSAPPLGV